MGRGAQVFSVLGKVTPGRKPCPYLPGEDTSGLSQDNQMLSSAPTASPGQGILGAAEPEGVSASP